MDRVRIIPGIQWAANIMTGRQPFPYMQEKRKKSENSDFQSLLDKEMERLNNEGHGGSDR